MSTAPYLSHEITNLYYFAPMKKILAVMMLASATTAMAQTQKDPILMTIQGQQVPRSEFEYSFNKNNAEGVIDKKSVDEYVDLFINYKLKVLAAKDARLDTLTSFKREFAQYRDQQVRPTLINEAEVEAEAQKIYQQTKENIGPKGLVKPAHILLFVRQKDSEEKKQEAKQRIDSIYQALKDGADFAELAKKYSQDPGSAKNGGELPWVAPKQTLQEFEDAAYKLENGQMSEPVLTAAGYHIIKMIDRKQLEPYDSLRQNILRFIEQRHLRERIIDAKISAMVEASNGQATRESIMTDRADSLSLLDRDMKYLIQEYYDGLLLYEISNRTVWEKAAQDHEALAAFFKKNKKKYAWTEPRFKGIAYHVKDQKDVKAVKDCVKKLPFDKWAEALRTTFNNDSVIRIRVEKGIFKQGDNALVDREKFKKDTTVTAVKDYPIDAVYGKMLKTPEEFGDVRGQVTADYQDELEKAWVEELRRKYSVKVNSEVLETVNKHD